MSETEQGLTVGMYLYIRKELYIDAPSHTYSYVETPLSLLTHKIFANTVSNTSGYQYFRIEEKGCTLGHSGLSETQRSLRSSNCAHNPSLNLFSLAPL